MRLALTDPDGLGGVVLHGHHGPARDALLAGLERHGPLRRIPPDVDVEALRGGIDATATLAAGRPVARPGLLDAARGGVLLLAGGERLRRDAAAELGAWLDRDAEAAAEGPGDTAPGPSRRLPTRAPLVLLDESLDHSPLLDSALGDRLALHVEVPALSLAALERAIADDPAPPPAEPAASFGDIASVTLPDDTLEELVRMADRLDVPSARTGVQVCRAARAAARLAGRDAVLGEDAALAVQLVLAPRARCVPDADDDVREPDTDERTAEESADEATVAPDGGGNDEPPDADAGDAPAPPPPGPAEDAAPDDAADEPPDGAEALPERLVAAAAAALPRNLLDELAGTRAGHDSATGRDASVTAADERKGRPTGVRRPRGSGGERLNLAATLKAAIPYQRLRAASPGAVGARLGMDADPVGIPRRGQAEGSATADRRPEPRLRVRRDDFRVTRYRQPTRTTTLFAVDASGSAAMHRLAEAKGAVESLLAECYVRRDRVALITFRGTKANLDLPPTRSLVRARRALIGLPGGGGTPLAAGFDLAADVLERLVREGESPVGVFMTDARGNIARDGTASREAAREDAERGAARLARLGVRLLFVDTAPRPRPDARRLAATMRARYLPLPQLDTAVLGASASGGDVRR